MSCPPEGAPWDRTALCLVNPGLNEFPHLTDMPELQGEESCGEHRRGLLKKWDLVKHLRDVTVALHSDGVNVG